MHWLAMGKAELLPFSHSRARNRPRLVVVHSSTGDIPELPRSDLDTLELIAGSVRDASLATVAVQRLAEQLDWASDRLLTAAQEWSEGARDRMRGQLVHDDATALAWRFLSANDARDAAPRSTGDPHLLISDPVRYFRAAEVLLGQLPPLQLAVPPGQPSETPLALVVKLAEGLPRWELALIYSDAGFGKWLMALPDTHTKAVLRSSSFVETGNHIQYTAIMGAEEAPWGVREPTPVESHLDGGAALDTDPLTAQLEAARRALAEVIDVGTGKPLESATNKGVERARSQAELLLFRLLESLSETRGLFALNARMAFHFGPRPAEIDLFSQALGLCVEVDGPHHFVDTDGYRRDRRKDALLQRHDLWVIRVLAEDVVERMEYVRDHVLAAVRARRAHRGEESK